MYSVLFNTDNQWVKYTTSLSLNEALQIAHMLTKLEYEVHIKEHSPLLTEVDYLIEAVRVLEREGIR